jgi:hypothetical protein
MTSTKLMQTFVLGIGMALAGAGFSPSYAGDCGCDPEPIAKGNNGWGQEKNQGTNDGTNAGSDNGATADSKTASTER